MITKQSTPVGPNPFYQQPNLWYPAKALQETEYINICIWYDFTLKPMKGHNGNCRWKFDGQIWRHL